MKKHIEKVLKSKRDFVICNWSDEKDITEALKTKILWSSHEDSTFAIIGLWGDTLIEEIKEIAEYDSSLKIIENGSDKEILIIKKNRMVSEGKSIVKEVKINISVFEDIKYVKTSAYSFVFINGIYDIKDLIKDTRFSSLMDSSVYLFPKNSVYCIDDHNLVEDVSSWSEKEIRNLMEEYSKLSNWALCNDKNNTITRKALLDMINDIKRIEKETK